MPKLSQQTIEQIAAANDVVDVIGSYFPLRRAGAVFKAICPFHQEKTPSFTVNPQRQIFKCFGCGAGGSVFKFVELYEHVSFPDAARKLAERGGVPIIEDQFDAEEESHFRIRKRLLSLHAQAADWFHRQLMKGEAAAPAREYMKKRGISSEVARAWKIGYAPDEWNALGSWARQEGFSGEELLASGLVKTKEEDPATTRESRAYDRFRGRVIFPICNDYGEVVAFSGRILQGDAQAAKYINSPETPLFIKGNILFGLHRSKPALIEKGAAIVCEGQLDLITAFEAGIRHVIAPQGTAFTDKQARILKRFVQEVVLCFDADAAGQKAAERSLASLLEADLIIRVVELPAGHDPDSLIRTQGAAAFTQLVDGAPDFFDYQIDRRARAPEFAAPRGKADFARKMGEWVGLLDDPILREAVIHKVAARLAMPADHFRKTLRRPRKSGAVADLQGSTASTSFAPLSPTMARLCQLSLNAPEGRGWLLQQPWNDVLAEHLDGALLAKTLAASVKAGDVQSINVFLDTLPAEEGAQLAGILGDRAPGEPERVVQLCWAGVLRDNLVRKKSALEAQLRASALSDKELNALQTAFTEINKQILDQQKRLTHIARPLSSDL